MRQTLSTFEIDALLREIARLQLGLVPVAQAAEHGIDRYANYRRYRAGALEPVFAGVARLASVAPSPKQRILAASLLVPGSVVAGPSAAVVHEMPLPKSLLSPSADVVLAVDLARTVRIDGIQAVRLQHPGRSTPWMTTRVSTQSATLVLLARYVVPSTLERCLDHGLAERTLSVKSVLDVIARSPTRAIGNLKALEQMLADRSDGAVGHRSGLEQRVRGWLDEAGLSGWAANLSVRIDEDEEVEVDFGWVGPRVALEVSPFYTHGSRVKQDRDAERRRLLGLVGWSAVEAIDCHLIDQAAFAPIVDSLRFHLAASAA